MEFFVYFPLKPLIQKIIEFRNSLHTLSSFVLSVPPNIDDSVSSSDVIVREGSNISLRCRATGSPTPTVKWKRDDSTRIAINRHINYVGELNRHLLCLMMDYKFCLIHVFFLVSRFSQRMGGSYARYYKNISTRYGSLFVYSVEWCAAKCFKKD